MVRGDLILADHGPVFIGLIGKALGKLVCVATPKVEEDAAKREFVRDLVRREGGDCYGCHNCLIGRRD